MYHSNNGFLPSSAASSSLVTDRHAKGGGLTPGRVEDDASPSSPFCNTGVNTSVYSPSSLVCSGVDFLRLTCKDDVISTRLSLLAFHLANDVAEQDGCERRPLNLYGYDGFMCGPVFYGERYDSVMLQVSGEAAAAILPDILPFSGSVNITRLDAQATVMQEVNSEYFRRVADASKSASDECAVAGRPWKVRYIDGYGDGDTVYIGSRRSIHFGRVYDKHKESLGRYPAGAVRVEVELHDEYATAFFARLARADDVEQHLIDYVFAWFARRGVVFSFPSGPSDPVRVAPAPTSDEKSLRWLGSQVKPTMQRLIERGKESEALSALGIAASQVRSGIDDALARLADKRRGAAAAARFAGLPASTFGFDALRQDLINRLSGYSSDECDEWLKSNALRGFAT